MADLKTYISLNVKGDAAHKVDELEKGFDRLAKRGATHMGALSRSMGMAGKGLDHMANRYTALLSGAGAAGAVKMVSDLDTRMTYLGITAGKSTKDMDALKRKIFETAQAPDIRVDPAGIIDAVDVIIEKTGNLELAEQNIRTIGIAMRATQAEGKDIGNNIAQNFEKFKISSAEDLLSALDHTVNAAKAGSVSVAELSSKHPQLASAYSVTGRAGKQAAAEIDAVMQMMIKGSGGIDQATTAFEAFMRTLNDGTKRKALVAQGIKIMDPDDPKRMRAATDIIKDIVTKAKGDVVKVSSIFDSEAMRGLNPIITQWNDNGDFRDMDKFMNVASDGKAILADAATAAKTFGASMQSLSTAWQQFADANLTEPVRDLADALNSFKPDQVQSTMKALAWGAGAIGGAIAIKKGVDAVRWTADSLAYLRGKGGGKGGGIAGGLAGAAGGGGLGGQAIPVIVMNWPGAGGGGGNLVLDGADTNGKQSGKTAPAKGVKGTLGRLAGRGSALLGGLARRAGPIAAALGAVEGIDALLEGDTRRALGAAGQTVGGFLGGAVGGAAGTLVAPGAGTALGGILGATAGATGGEALLTKLYDWLAGDKPAAKVEGALSLDLNLPPGFSATVKTATTSPGLDVDLGTTF